MHINTKNTAVLHEKIDHPTADVQNQKKVYKALRIRNPSMSKWENTEASYILTQMPNLSSSTATRHTVTVYMEITRKPTSVVA
jgi:hypothetical protein